MKSAIFQKSFIYFHSIFGATAYLSSLSDSSDWKFQADRDGIVDRLRETHSSLAREFSSSGVDVDVEPQLQREMSQAASLDAARVQAFLAQQLAKQERLNDALHELLSRTFVGFKWVEKGGKVTLLVKISSK